jgi:hypothetical protein
MVTTPNGTVEIEVTMATMGRRMKTFAMGSGLRARAEGSNGRDGHREQLVALPSPTGVTNLS